MLTSVEATRIEKSMMEWLKKEMPGFRKNAHFKSGLAKTRITAYRYFRLDLKFIVSDFSPFWLLYLKSILSKDEIDLDKRGGHFYYNENLENLFEGNFWETTLDLLAEACRGFFWGWLGATVGSWAQTIANNIEYAELINNCHNVTTIYFVSTNDTAQFWTRYFWLIPQ